MLKASCFFAYIANYAIDLFRKINSLYEYLSNISHSIKSFKGRNLSFYLYSVKLNTSIKNIVFKCKLS